MENIYKSKFIATLFLLITSTVAFAQIPNAGFETWTSGSCGLYSYKDATGWGDLNSSTCLVGDFTVQKTTAPANVHSGLAALELYSQYISFASATAPGIIATGTINTTTQVVQGGFAQNTRPDKFIGWYLYAPVSPDTFNLSVNIYSGATSVSVPLGTGSATGSNAVSTYKKFIANITYTDQTTAPDSAQITMLCSAGANGQSGTKMYIDDLAFISCAGFASTHTVVNPGCNTATGSITLGTPVGGTGPYTYAWSGGSTATTLASLAPGNYKVTVTDDNTCTAVDSINLVAVNTPFTVNATPTSTSCGNTNTGTVTVSASAGNAPYTYLWSNGNTTTEITGLGAGNYPITVTDANGCTTSASGSVTTPNGPTAAVNTITNLKCYNDSTGAISVNSTGGTGNITYAWNNGATSLSLTNVAAGNYSLTISDANNCSFEVTATITQPNALSLTGAATNNACYGLSTGTASVNATNGTPPYYYSWNNGADTSFIAGLPAGTYVATVLDTNNCRDTFSLTVTQPTTITVSFVTTNASSVNASDGAILATATGGTGTLTYSWVTGSVKDSVNHLSPSAYCVTITDANSCSINACDTVGYSQGTNGITVVSSISFKVYPNPASSQLTIETNSTDGKFQFNLYSLDGRLVEQTIIAGEKSFVVLNKVADGLYTYQLKDTVTGAINYGKLQIQR